MPDDINNRNKPAQISNAEKAKIAKAVNRVNSTPRGRPTGPSSYHPGLTLLLNGTLTQKVSTTTAGKFKQYAAPDPTTTTTGTEADVGYAEENCFLWAMESGKGFPIGAKVVLAWIGGRWYVIAADRCPTAV